MKRYSDIARLVCTAGLVLAWIATSTAEEPLPIVTSTVTTPADNPRMFDRDGQRIVGFELMSDTEVSGYRALLFSIKDPAVREQARAEHRKAMEKRATERGVKLQE